MSIFVSLGGNWKNLLLLFKFIGGVNEKSLINLLLNDNFCHKALHSQTYFTNMWNQPEIKLKRRPGKCLQEDFYILHSKLEKCKLRIFPFEILNLICVYLCETCLGFAYGRNQLRLKRIYPAKIQTFQICWDADSDYKITRINWNSQK